MTAILPKWEQVLWDQGQTCRTVWEIRKLLNLKSHRWFACATSWLSLGSHIFQCKNQTKDSAASVFIRSTTTTTVLDIRVLDSAEHTLQVREACLSYGVTSQAFFSDWLLSVDPCSVCARACTSSLGVFQWSSWWRGTSCSCSPKSCALWNNPVAVWLSSQDFQSLWASLSEDKRWCDVLAACMVYFCGTVLAHMWQLCPRNDGTGPRKLLMPNWKDFLDIFPFVHR